MGDWEWIAYACASALLGGALPSFVKTGVHRTPPSVAAAIYATAVFLFSLGAAAISGTLGSVSGLDNATLVNLVLCGALRALVWLCLFAALSTGNVNRVMPVHNLAPALAIGASALLFDTAIGVWRLCCLVLLLLGTVLMESRQQKGRGYRWLLFACLALAGTTARDVLCARLLPNVPDSLQNLMEAFVAMLALWVLSAAGRTFGSLKKLQPESWLFLLLAGASTGVALLCDASAARLGDSTYLLPISCLAFPLMFLFARVIHKEKTPAAAVLGLLLAVFGMFGLLLNV